MAVIFQHKVMPSQILTNPVIALTLPKKGYSFTHPMDQNDTSPPLTDQLARRKLYQI